MRALPSGNIVVAGASSPGRSATVCLGIDRRPRTDRLSRAGRAYDHVRSVGSFPADRVGFFQTGRWLRWDLPRRCHFGSVGDCGGCRALCSWRSSRSRGSARSRCRAFGLCPSCCCFLAVHPWAKNDGSYLFTYPGSSIPSPAGAARRGDRHADQRSDRACLGCLEIAWWLCFRNGATLIVHTCANSTLADWASIVHTDAHVRRGFGMSSNVGGDEIRCAPRFDPKSDPFARTQDQRRSWFPDRHRRPALRTGCLAPSRHLRRFGEFSALGRFDPFARAVYRNDRYLRKRDALSVRESTDTC